MTTVRQALADASEALGAISEEARIDAEFLLTHATGFCTTQLLIKSEQALSETDFQRFTELVERRLTGEPIAYITTQKHFHEITLSVGPDVLIPRSDTELLVEQALALITVNTATAVLDLGTGSGAIALSIAAQRPLALITAVDQNAGACKVARQNAAALKFENINVICGSWFEPIGDAKFSIIVSNPPYIAPGDPHLERGDLRFEPQSALVALDDGLACFKDITSSAKAYLLREGCLLFEHGFDQGIAVREILLEHQFTNVQTHQDLSGNDRVTVGVNS
ncbi:MAG: release factor glutamine methyltransferase [Saprospiraceae bacterium]|jgi:release factor glutamine methyltransferase